MLNEFNFKSIFKYELNYFIKYKRSLGYEYKQQVNILKLIDEIFYNLNLKTKKIDKEIFKKLTERKTKSTWNYIKQYQILKDFCKFLIFSGYKNIYYEERAFKINRNYIPIIFSKNEINKLFKIMDKYAENNINSRYYTLYYTYSIFFRLLYSCGLRFSEAVKIKINDINFKENTINIINSKFKKSRIVVFSNSMKKCLEDYITKFNIQDDLLFRNINNKTITRETSRKFYKKMLKNANLNTNAHIHDLRHCFANDALNQMLERGYNENVIIVYLHKYMGHSSIYNTEYYLHFTDYNKKKLLEINNNFTKSLYEEVDLNE